MEKFFSFLTESYYTLGEVNEHGIWNLCITNGSSVWTTTISRTDLEQRAAAADVPANNYVKELKLSLSGLAANAVYTFHIAQTSSKELDVTWKKSVRSDLKTILGVFKLKLVGNKPEDIQAILQKLADQTKELNSSLSTANEQVEKLEKTSESAVKKYSEVVNEMREKEDRLLEKFAVVLNEKKNRIRELEDDGVSPPKKRAVPPKATIPKTSKNIQKVKQILSDSDDGASADFDSIPHVGKSATLKAEEGSSEDDLFPKDFPVKVSVRPRQPPARKTSKKLSSSKKKPSTELNNDSINDLYQQM